MYMMPWLTYTPLPSRLGNLEIAIRLRCDFAGPLPQIGLRDCLGSYMLGVLVGGRQYLQNIKMNNTNTISVTVLAPACTPGDLVAN